MALFCKWSRSHGTRQIEATLGIWHYLSSSFAEAHLPSSRTLHSSAQRQSLGHTVLPVSRAWTNIGSHVAKKRGVCSGELGVVAVLGGRVRADHSPEGGGAATRAQAGRGGAEEGMRTQGDRSSEPAWQADRKGGRLSQRVSPRPVAPAWVGWAGRAEGPSGKASAGTCPPIRACC